MSLLLLAEIQGLRWLEWFGAVGTVGTLGGLFFTWRQARDAKNQAAEAKNTAQEVAETAKTMWTKLNAIHLQATSGHLRSTARSIDRAVEKNSKPWMRHHLGEWRMLAGQMSNLVGSQGNNDLATRLTATSGLARTAAEELADQGKSVRQATQIARDEINECVDEIDQFAHHTALHKEVENDAP